MEDNLMLIATIIAGIVLVSNNVEVGYVVMALGATNRYLADIHNQLKGK